MPERRRYNASPPEVLDLIDFTGVRNRSLLRTEPEAGVVTVELPAPGSDLPGRDGQLVLEPLRGEPQPAPLAVYAGDQHIIPSRFRGLARAG